MKRDWRLGFALAGSVVLAIAAVCVAPTSAAPPRSSPRASKRAPVLGHLLLRRHRVTFKAGDRFTVYTRDGKRVAEDVTLSQLKVIEPGLYEALQPIVAGDAFVYAGK